MDAAVAEFQQGHLSYVVSSFCYPANSLLGPRKGNKIIIDKGEQIGAGDDASLTSSTLTLAWSLKTQHPVCILLTDACSAMERVVGCGFTYMLTLCGRLINVGNRLSATGLNYYMLSQSLISAKQTAIDTIELLKIPIRELQFSNGPRSSPLLEISHLHALCNNRCVQGCSDSGRRVSDLVLESAVLLLRLKDGGRLDGGGLGKWSYKFVRDKIQIVTIAGPRVQESKVKYGALIPVADTEAEGWRRSFNAGAGPSEHRMRGFGIIHGSVKNEDQVGRAKLGGTVYEVDQSDGVEEIVGALKGAGAAVASRMDRIVQDLVTAGVQILCVCGDVSEEFMSACDRLELLVLKNLSLQDGERLALLSGATIVPHLFFLLKGKECIGVNDLCAGMLCNGWVDPADAIFTASPQKTGSRVKVRGQAVHYLQFTLAQGAQETTKQLPIFLALCHPVYSACKDMTATFWNGLNRLLNTLSSGFVLPGTGLTEMVLDFVFQSPARQGEEFPLVNNIEKFIWEKVGVEFKNQVLQVFENRGDGFDASLEAYEGAYSRVAQTCRGLGLHNPKRNLPNLLLLSSSAGRLDVGIQIVSSVTPKADRYDCYLSKLDGIEKAFETALLALGCDKLITNVIDY